MRSSGGKIQVRQPSLARQAVLFGSAAFVALAAIVGSMAVQSKPIDRCVAQSVDPLVQQMSEAGVPGVGCASLPQRSPLVVAEPTDMNRVLAKASSGVANDTQNAGEQSECSALRGSHEAKSTMLQSIQRRLSDYENRHERWRRTVAGMRSSGVSRKQLLSANARLTEARSVLGVLRTEFLQRSEELNSSMSRLTRVCLRG